MKTKKSLVTILAVVIVVIASAVEKPKMNVQSLSSDEILVTVQNPQATQVEISIRNESGDIVYYKRTQKPISSFNKIFDVKNLENGNYAMTLEVNGLTLERSLSINSDKIRIGNTEEYSTPYFAFNGERLVITHLNFENKKYRLCIYDDNGLVYKTSLENKSPLNSGFDLSKLHDGNYNVVLNSGTNEFAYQFTREKDTKCNK